MSIPSLFSNGIPLLFPSLAAAAANSSLTYDQNLNPTTAADNSLQSITVAYKLVGGGTAVPCLVRFARNGMQVIAYMVASSTLQFQLINRRVVNLIPTEPLPISFATTFAPAEVANLGTSVVSNNSVSYQGFWNVSIYGQFAFTITEAAPTNGVYWFGQSQASSQVAVGSWLNATPSTTSPSGAIIGGTNITVSTVGLDSTISTVNAPVFSGGLTIGNYSLPTAKGTAGQVLSTGSGSTLVWEDAAEVTAGDNIHVSGGVVSLVAAPTVDEITIGGYTMPPALGAPSQVLTVPASGTILSWEDTTAVGEVTAGANIVVTPSGNDVTVALASTIDVTGVTVNNYSLPAAIGTSGQVLTVPSSGSALLWATPTDTGITAITGDANVRAVTTGSTTALSLGNTLNVGGVVTQYLQSPTVVCTNQYTLPLTIGTAGQTMQVQTGTGQMQFGTTVNSLTTTDPNIVLAGSASAKTVALNNDLTTASLTCQEAGVELGVGGATVINSDGIAISNAGNNNLTLGANSIALDAPGYTTQLTSAGVFTSAFTVVNGAGTTQYVLPSTLGQPNQMLTVPPLGNQLVWDNQNPSSGISAVNSGTNITVNTVGQVATVNLSDPVSINEIKAAVVEAELVRVIDDSDVEVYALPTALGTAGQVLTVPTSGSTLYWSTTAGSGIATITPGANISTVVNNEDVTVSVNEVIALEEITTTTAKTQTLDIVNSGGTTIYQLPATLGTSGQVLAAPSSGTTLYWTSGTGTPGLSNVVGESNIYATVLNEVATVGLEPSITVDTVSAGLIKAESLTVVSSADEVIYEFPAAIGTSGQVLAAPSSGNQLYWSSTAGAGIESVTGTGGIIANTVNEEVTLELDSIITVTGVKSQHLDIVNEIDVVTYSLPTTIGDVGQVLAVQTESTTLGWNAPGITQVSGDANIQATPSGSSVSLALGSTINVGTVVTNYVQSETIVCSGQYTLPLAIGSVGDVMVVQSGSGQLVWAANGGGSPGLTNVISTNANISTELNGTDAELTLASNLNISNLTADNQIEVTAGGFSSIITSTNVSTKSLSITGDTGLVVYDLPPSLGSAGQVLTVPAEGNVLEWNTGAVSITSANANISVASTGESVELTLGSTLDIEQATFSLEADVTTVSSTGIVVGTLPNRSELTTASLTLTQLSGATSTLTPTGLETPAVRVNNAYNLPTTIGSPGQLMVAPTTGTTLLWATDSTSGLVTSANANIGVTNEGNAAVLTLSDNLSIVTTDYSALTSEITVDIGILNQSFVEGGLVIQNPGVSSIYMGCNDVSALLKLSNDAESKIVEVSGVSVSVATADSASSAELEFNSSGVPRLSLVTPTITTNVDPINGIVYQASDHTPLTLASGSLFMTDNSTFTIALGTDGITYEVPTGYCMWNDRFLNYRQTDLFNIVFDMGSGGGMSVPTYIVGNGTVRTLYMKWPTTAVTFTALSGPYLSSFPLALPDISYAPDPEYTIAPAHLQLSSSIVSVSSVAGLSITYFTTSMFMNIVSTGLNTYNFYLVLFPNPSTATPSPEFGNNQDYAFNYYPTMIPYNGNNTWAQYSY